MTMSELHACDLQPSMTRHKTNTRAEWERYIVVEARSSI